MGGREVQLQPTPRSAGTGQVPDHQLPAWGATCLQERINWLKGFFTCYWIPCYHCDYSTNDSWICYPQASQESGKRSWLAARHRAGVPQPKPHGEPERFCNVPWPCLAVARVCCHLLCFWIGIISDWADLRLLQGLQRARSYLRGNFPVIVHCNSGLHRAPQVAASLLMRELGVSWKTADPWLTIATAIDVFQPMTCQQYFQKNQNSCLRTTTYHLKQIL